MSENTQKVSAIVKLVAKPGRRDDIAKAFADVRSLVDDEPGTEQYVLHLDQGNEDVAWVVEVYSDQTAFEAHGGGQVIATLMGALGDALVDGGFEMNLAAPLPGAKGILEG
jgi:quinol monooxygenase YgiN